MSNWFVMRTVPDKEEEAAALMQRVLPNHLWKQCRVLYKQKLFKTAGRYLVTKEKMFPGYLFIQTDQAKELQKELNKARKFPKLIGNQNVDVVPVTDRELGFLKSTCGEELQYTMGLSRIQVDEEGNITRIEGVLKPYVEQITRKRLRKRYVLARVELFNRVEDILFGIVLEKDEIVDNREANCLKGA